jgi:hypothetical protein
MKRDYLWLKDDQFARISRTYRPTCEARLGSMTAGDQRYHSRSNSEEPLIDV